MAPPPGGIPRCSTATGWYCHAVVILRCGSPPLWYCHAVGVLPPVPCRYHDVGSHAVGVGGRAVVSCSRFHTRNPNFSVYSLDTLSTPLTPGGKPVDGPVSMPLTPALHGLGAGRGFRSGREAEERQGGRPGAGVLASRLSRPLASGTRGGWHGACNLQRPCHRGQVPRRGIFGPLWHGACNLQGTCQLPMPPRGTVNLRWHSVVVYS